MAVMGDGMGLSGGFREKKEIGDEGGFFRR